MMNMKKEYIRATTVARLLLGTVIALCILAPGITRAAEEQADGRVRALVISALETTISSEIAATITSITRKPGEGFSKGDRLVTFDNGLFAARLQKARVDLDTAREVLKANQKLMQFKSISELELVTSRAKVAQAEAEVRLYSIQLSKCRINAPFSGRVVSRPANPHQFVQEGTPLLELVDDRNLELQMFVPSNWVGGLKKGMNITVDVDELGISCPARISTLGARVDSSSRTIEVRADIDGTHPGLLPGMSGTARFTATN